MNIFVSIASLLATFLRSSLYGAVSRQSQTAGRLARHHQSAGTVPGIGLHRPAAAFFAWYRGCRPLRWGLWHCNIPQ